MKSNSTELKSRLKLLKAVPLFSSIPEGILAQLALLCNNVSFELNQEIVREHEPVDSVYIIKNGKAEVSRMMAATEGMQQALQAMLRDGDTIGLTSTGFFSQTGVRTATVKAITPLQALRLDLAEFKQFLMEHDSLDAELMQASDKLLRLQFIKQVEPFANINQDILEEFIQHLEEVTYQKGEIIIQQDEAANCCFMLISGSVDIFLKKQNGQTALLETLKETGTLFGEIALLTNNTRNASVIASSDCKLYSLSKEYFLKLTNQSLNVSMTLTNLMMDRHRPQAISGVTVHERLSVDNRKVIILKSEKLGVYFKTDESGLFVWELLDGEQTIMDISVQFFHRFHTLAIDSIGSLIMQLMRAGLVVKPDLVSDVKKERLSLWRRSINKLSDMLTYTYSVYHVDSRLTWLYDHVGYLFYKKAAHIFYAVMTVLGFIAFLLFLPHTRSILSSTPHAWTYMIWMGPVSMFIIPLHELAHALTTKAYGRQVLRMGIGWFWLGPMAFTDTSDMWLSTRWPRMAVCFSGVYLNWIVSGILAVIAWVCLNDFPHAAAFIWLVALSSYLMGFYNLDPTFELDGYYILMNFFDKSNLRSLSTYWLVNDLKKTFKQPSLALQHIPEITYWILTIVFILLFAGVGFLTFTYVFSAFLPTHVGDHEVIHWRWALTAFLIFISFEGVYSRLKKSKQLYIEE